MSETKDPKNDVNAARRRLLRMAVYVPPIVIGSIALSQAGCQPDPCPSCPPFGGTAMCRVAPPSATPPEVETAAPTESEF